MNTPTLLWDFGSGYDLFISLNVLHNPARFGLRGSWTAGVRSRLLPANRKTLEQADAVFWIPFAWLHRLPAPKDGATVLQALQAIPPECRLPDLAVTLSTDADVANMLQEVAAARRWKPRDLEILRQANKQHGRNTKAEHLEQVLAAWSQPVEFGEQYAVALQDYYESFFAEEERRILPALKASLEHAQSLAQRLELPELLEELSQGVRFVADLNATEMVLAPSFWNSPLLMYSRVGETRWLFVYGGRPTDVSLVPGEQIPDMMLRALKALADPTRLRILRYLNDRPLTPTQLARRLRLRAPTVIHHLSELRLSGLVHLTVDSTERKSERRYSVRPDAVQRVLNSLQSFINQEDTEVD